MGGLPDASRVGGVWFPDTCPEEWVLPNGLASRVITPALVVDLEKVRKNVACVKRLLNGDLSRWRPHLKTTKLAVVWVELVNLGVRNFKIATTKEAFVLAVTLDAWADTQWGNDVSDEKTNLSKEKEKGDGAGAHRHQGKKAKTAPSNNPLKETFEDEKIQESPQALLAKRLAKENFGFDVLVAYPLVGAARQRLSVLAKAFPWIRWSVLIETPESLTESSDGGFTDRLTRWEQDNVGYFVDVNPGMHRTGAEAGEDVRGAYHKSFDGDRQLFSENENSDGRAENIWRTCQNCVLDNRDTSHDPGGSADTHDPGSADNTKYKGFRGIHFYEGHISDPVARSGASTEEVEVLRRKRNDSCRSLYENKLAPLLCYLKQKGVPPIELVTSGTPGFTHALRLDVVAEMAKLEMAAACVSVGSKEANDGGWLKTHRVSPGTVVFHDWRGERQNPNLGLVPAAVLMTRVVSLPAKNRATLDCGSKALAAEAGDPACYVIGHPTWRALACSEEHLPLVIGEQTYLSSSSYFSRHAREQNGLHSAENDHSIYHRPSASGVLAGGEASGADAGSIYVDDTRRKRPWDVALAKRRVEFVGTQTGTGTTLADPCSPGTHAGDLIGDKNGDTVPPRTGNIPGDATKDDNDIPTLQDIPTRGDLVFVIPEHICPTVNLAEQAIVLDKGKLVGVVAVEARGHEVIPPDTAPAITTEALRKAVEESTGSFGERSYLEEL